MTGLELDFGAFKFQFKITKNKELWLLKNSKYADRSESGKFITLYPKDEVMFTQVLQELGQRLKHIKSGPYILSDRQWQDSCLYYRYGAFKKITMKKSGKTVYCIYTPDGKKIEDRREPYYNQPSFIDEPAFVKNNNFKTAGYPGDELKNIILKGRFILAMQ